ncbi:alpha-hydroxy acid oxidase, partial [Flavisphingomonas formosensis]|uniref:alpha-hydroxy acid oxidase n=1 Tax=Flavisphingomonas formosensis TaxID=861534 RepID=UPI0018DFA640
MIENRSRRAFTVADLRSMARRALPRPIFEYIDSGADNEVSLLRNSSAFEEFELIPDVLNDVSCIRTEAVLFGRVVKYPLMLSPTGLTRMFHRHAEGAVARAAAKRGLLYSWSTMGTTRIEEVARISDGPKVFQIYIFKDRGLTRDFIARSKAAGFDGLIVTVDTPVAGNRIRDRINGLAMPPHLTLKTVFQFAIHPNWSLQALFGSKFDLANVNQRVDALAGGGGGGVGGVDIKGGQVGSTRKLAVKGVGG